MSIALTGAGGKSSSMARIAQELKGISPVILTTSTKLLDTQHTLAEKHCIIRARQDLQELPRWLEEADSIVITGPHSAEDPKWLGLDEACLKDLRDYCSKRPAVLAIEADGARGRSLKAPAEHEPAVPDWVDLVVPLVGLDVVGKPLNAANVHRVRQAAAVLGLPPDMRIEPRHIVEFLRHPEGAKRGVPRGAAVRVLLNKSETPGRLASGRVIAKAMMTDPEVNSTLICSLHQKDPVIEAYSRVAGMILAAGGSSRLEQPKQLITWRGRSLVWYAVNAAVQSGLLPIVVVTGCEAERVRSALAGFSVGYVNNLHWQEGQSTSFKAGLEAVKHTAEAVIALLSDMPFVDGEVVEAVVKRYRQTLAPLVAPQAGGKRANPVLFDRVTYGDLAKIEGDQGGRPLFDSYDPVYVNWDERIRFDVDTVEDLDWLRTQ
ncbi:MAG: putative selenium-dependent hydroxylase accessory protein YqeC [Anaerolineales bacterium]|nr:putative selenium-dependent hydroxylase accessory protein YqeC [Anaerolineales bacterium]